MSAVSGHETDPAVVAPGVKPPLAVPRRLLRMRSDAALVERFAAGDESAFDVIYERHRPVVLAVSMGVLGTPQDAEDATQETFSALAVALRTRPPAELRPWLIRVARNASIDTTRRRRHRLLTLDGEIPEVAARPAGSGQAELAVVLDGIRELPEGQRMALLMRELGGHTYSEIAEFLETDEEAVKGLIARARVGLRSYREATELSCATARSTIEAEPDGRRYDKTIRRHLRGCGACRSYREALRDDAKALRAALPIQAGSVATGSLSSGLLSTAKGSLLGYGLTQAATTCATTACAVGAIGGMVFVGPVHRFGVQPLLPANPAPVVVHRHVSSARKPVGRPRAAQKQAVAPAMHYAPAATDHASVSYSKPAVTRGTAKSGHPHHPDRRDPGPITRVRLPKLPAKHMASAASANPLSDQNPQGNQSPQAGSPSWTGGPGGQGSWSQGSAGQQGSWSQGGGSQGSWSQGGGSQGNGAPANGQAGNSQGSRWDSGQNTQGGSSSSASASAARAPVGGANTHPSGRAAPSTTAPTGTAAAPSAAAASGKTTPPTGTPASGTTDSSSSSAWGNGSAGQGNGGSQQSPGASGQAQSSSDVATSQGASNKGAASQGVTSQAGGTHSGSSTATDASTSTGGSSHTGSGSWSHHDSSSSSGTGHGNASSGTGSSQSPTWGNGHGSGSGWSGGQSSTDSSGNSSAWGS